MTEKFDRQEYIKSFKVRPMEFSMCDAHVEDYRKLEFITVLTHGVKTVISSMQGFAFEVARAVKGIRSLSIAHKKTEV